MQLGITQIDFTNAPSGGAVLHIFGRDTDGKAHRVDLTGFVPYYFIPVEQADKMVLPSIISIDKSRIFKSIYGDELRKVECKGSPIDIHVTKNLYQHFEADIPFHVRYMIDNHITSGIETDSDLCDYRLVKPCDVKTPTRVCFLDIECSDEKGFPEPDRDPVTAITMYDNFDDKYTTLALNVTGKPVQIRDPPQRKTYMFEDEKKMLQAFCDYIKQKDPDIISGWNVRDFDIDYLVKRLATFEINIKEISRLPPSYGDKRNSGNIRGRNVFDLLEAYKKITTASGKRESYRLDAIAEYELKEHKVHFNGSVMQLAKDDPQKFIDYNYKDVELCVGIDKKIKIVEFYRQLASFVGCPLDKTLDSSSVVDIYVLRKAYKKFILPSKGFATEEKFEGATVLNPSKGVKENVVVLDLKSLYPMSMITMNASPETKDPLGELHSPPDTHFKDGIHFKKEPIGLVREIILELLEKRDALKKKMKSLDKESNEYQILDMQQNVLKIIMNTYYGVSGYPRFRMFDNEIASAVTACGRAIIEFTRQYVESKGYKVVYGDSVTGDSIINIFPYFGNKCLKIKIEDLFTHISYTDGDKEYCNICAFTDSVSSKGFGCTKQIKYVMRHKTNKQIYRVTCDNGYYVNVTEDHSLIAGKFINNKFVLYEIKPTDDDIYNADLLCWDKRVKVVSVDLIDYNDYVYDLEIDETHKFFANGILVHNTDSCMIEIHGVSDPEEVKKIASGLQDELNVLYPKFAKDTLNADTSFFSTKFEKYYRRFFQGGKKKRYAGHLIWKEGQDRDDIDITGFESKRSDSPKLARDVMKKILEMVLRGSTKEEVRVYLSEVIKKYRKGEYSYDLIGIPGGIQKNLEDYAVDDAHVRGCKYANEYLGTQFLKGSKPKRLYIKSVNGKYPKTDVLCFEYSTDVPKEFNVDYEKMFEKTLKSPLERIFEPLGWSFSEFDPSKTTLAMFGLGD